MCVALSVYHSVFIIIATGNDVEREGSDRADINLPGKQLQLLQDAASAASGKLQGFSHS